MRWSGEEPDIGTECRAVALSFYLALMTDTCLQLTGAAGPTIVEGPFAQNAEYLIMLKAATGRPVLTSDAATGTSIGAALLMGEPDELSRPETFKATEDLTAMKAYASQWHSIVGSA
jgi:sugar (pentulose or hexulose) kinase